MQLPALKSKIKDLLKWLGKDEESAIEKRKRYIWEEFQEWGQGDLQL